jgi:hypothetical protein
MMGTESGCNSYSVRRKVNPRYKPVFPAYFFLEASTKSEINSFASPSFSTSSIPL